MQSCSEVHFGGCVRSSFIQLTVTYEMLLKLAFRCDHWPRARATTHMELMLQDVSVVLQLQVLQRYTNCGDLCLPNASLLMQLGFDEGFGMTCLFA